MKTIVFIPTYNEKDNLRPLVEQILQLKLELQVLIVDDQSPDGTGQIADELAGEYPNRILVMHRDGPRGRGYAGIAGFQYAANLDTDVILEMDADLSHQPIFIPDFIVAIKESDVVIGSRYIPGGDVVGWGWYRKLNSWVANHTARWILGLNYADCTTGFRAFRKEAVRALPWETMISPGPSIVEEILYHCVKKKFRITEIPITFINREQGKSKISPKLILRWIISLFKVRLKK
ncbi:MAG: polyprenol monophosphomannose synthase [bacterium]|nr:polyprenol monophosphomannose synthase [bacterium]